MRVVAKQLTQSARLSWHPGQSSDLAWDKKLAAALAAEQSSLQKAYSQLETDAKFAEQRRFANLVAEVQHREAILHTISQVMPLFGDAQESVDAKLKAIEALSPDPHPLSEYGHPVTAKPKPRVTQISILSERCELLIGEEVRRIPTAHLLLDPILGETLIDKYENSAESVWKSLDVGETPRVFVGDSQKEIDPSTQRILKTASRDDDSLVKTLTEGFVDIR